MNDEGRSIGYAMLFIFGMGYLAGSITMLVRANKGCSAVCAPFAVEESIPCKCQEAK